ncbi:MAG TPA: SGNH/GDSL hydrolase family protein [Elusimicrobiota bacterium]|nr:SGNH/GDSL hydrolase family protein [Elusimicrobiota bacterium]
MSAGVLLGLLLGELAARHLCPETANGLRINKYMESERGKFCRYDDTLGWAGKPGAEDRFEWADCVSRVRQNAYGFRGPAYPFARTARPRFVALGDSFVWGFGVNEDELFTRRMEERSRSPVEVVNLGVSGYGTDQEYLLWQKTGRNWRPDHVLLFVTFVTDLYDNVSPQRYGYPKPSAVLAAHNEVRLIPQDARQADLSRNAVRETTVPLARPHWQAALRRSDLLCLALRTLLRFDRRHFLETHGFVPAMCAGHDWETELFRDPPSEETRRLWLVLAGLAKKLNEDVRRSGADLTVVLVPSVIQVYPKSWEKAVQNAPADFRLDPVLPARLLREVAEYSGARMVDLTPSLRAAARHRRVYCPLNGHWSSDGHRVVADALLNEFGLARPVSVFFPRRKDSTFVSRLFFRRSPRPS